MSLYKSNTWISDLDNTINSLLDLEEFNGKTVMIVGPNGLICSAIIDLLIRFNENYGGNISIVAAGRDKTRTKKRFSIFFNRRYFKFKKFDACDDKKLIINEKVDYVIYGASITSPKAITNLPVETMLSNFCGISKVLEYAKNNHVKRVLYISSSEVYGITDSLRPIKSNEYGYIDLLSTRSSYAVSKRASETLCISFSKEYDVNTVIIRPGHIYGPTLTEGDDRVSSLFMYNAAFGKNIVLKSDGSQIRSYCYCLDCAAAIVKVLLKGEDQQAYNISTPDSVVTIKTLAEKIAKYANINMKYANATKDDIKIFNKMNNSSLDSSQLFMIGWKPVFDIDTGVNHTIDILKEIE